MALVLRADARKCVGCRACELACIFQHEKRFRPDGRIRVLSGYPEPGIDLPVFCQHCEEMHCAAACPVGCILRDADTGAVVIDEGACTGCQACVLACPIGAISWNSERGMPEKCDLCGGSPACVEYCLHGALVIGGEAVVEGDLLHDYVSGTKQDFSRFVAQLEGRV